MKQEFINLNIEDYKAKGTQRTIFLDPRDNSKCIKVAMLEDLEKVKNRSKRWYKKLRSANAFSENLKEIKFYNSIKNKNEVIYNCIPRYYGTVETNLGQGIVVDYIDNAISLKKYIQNNRITDKLLNAFKFTLNTIYDNLIFIRDPHTENYVVQEKNGELKLFLIDGLGNPTLINFFNEIPFFKKRAILKRFKRLFRNLKKEFPQYQEYFKLENFIK